MAHGAVNLLLVAVTVATTTMPSVISQDPVPARQGQGSVHPHVHLTTAELVAARGYPAETHYVTTEDGYILEMHRIPHGLPTSPATTTTTTTTPHAYSTSHTVQDEHTTPHDRSYSRLHDHDHARSLPNSPIGGGEKRPQRAGQHEDDANLITAGGRKSDRSSSSSNEPPKVPVSPTDRRSSSNGPPVVPVPPTGRNSSGGPRVGPVPPTDSNSIRGPRVVFLLHGFLSSSADFVMNDPDQAIGFMMADAGYDVWMGNNRGNCYGRRHAHLSPNETEFWEYSWNEMARYDLPAMLSYVRNATGVEKMSYIGHSMGTSLFYAMLDYHPHINSWIRAMAAMAPSAYIYHKHAPIGMLSPYFNKIEKELRKQGVMEILRLTPAHTKKMSALCGPKSIFNALCIFIHFIIAGPNANYIDREYLPVIVAHTPAGTGLRVFTHLMQLHASHKFQAFDYGEEKNLAQYGKTSPPSFSLSRVTVPVGLFWSENDWIVHPLDVRQTASELPWVALDYRVQLRDFNHLDFLWAENANYLVYRPLMDFLEAFH